MKQVHFNTTSVSAPDTGSETDVSSIQSTGKNIITSGILRLAGWWSIFAGALALNSVCPVCGSTACPVGIGATGVIAGLLAGIKLYGVRIMRHAAGLFKCLVLPTSDHSACSCETCLGHINPATMDTTVLTADHKRPQGK